MYVYIYVRRCMYVCMYVCAYVCMLNITYYYFIIWVTLSRESEREKKRESCRPYTLCGCQHTVLVCKLWKSKLSDHINKQLSTHASWKCACRKRDHDTLQISNWTLSAQCRKRVHHSKYSILGFSITRPWHNPETDNNVRIFPVHLCTISGCITVGSENMNRVG